MQSASYTLKSSSRETKMNDQNKAGVRLRQFTQFTQIQLRRNLKWSRTLQRQRDIAKIFARKSREIAKAQQEVKLSNNKPDYTISQLKVKVLCKERRLSFQTNCKRMLCWYYQYQQKPGLNRLQETLMQAMYRTRMIHPSSFQQLEAV